MDYMLKETPCWEEQSFKKLIMGNKVCNFGLTSDL